MKFRAELEDYFVAYGDECNFSEIASKIKEEKPEIDLSFHTIRKHLSQIKRERTDITSLQGDFSWRVIGKDKYVFDVSGNTKTYSIALIDDLFLHYSENGYNYTGTMMCQKFNLTPKNWNEIKRMFMLQKKSDIISPYTLLNTPIDDLEDYREQQLEILIKSGERAKQKYDTKLRNQYRKVVEKDNLDQEWFDSIWLAVAEEMPQIQAIEVKKNVSVGGNDEICVVLADLHAGAKSSRSNISEEWSIEKLEESLEKVAAIINSYDAKRVNVYILGDLVETISGLNHPDNYKIIQHGWHGSQAIIGTYDILRKFVSQINNLVTFGGTGGNHDRLQASNKNGDVGATDLVFEFFKRYVNDSNIDLHINYDPVVVVDSFANFGLIGVHGDKGLHQRNTEYLMMKYADDPQQYQFILSAHLHSFFCKRGDDSEIARRVTIPSIVTGNDYSDVSVGRGSKSGFVVLKSNMFNEPTMIVENI